VVFSLGALIVFAFIGNRLSSPLVTLAARMEKVPEQERSYQPEAVRGDEIGQLQQSFARLLVRLNRAEAERELSVIRLVENERLATVGKLGSGIAHEINNPLAGIQATLFNMQRECAGSSQRYVDIVQKEIDRIGAIVRQLLDLSRAGALEMEPIVTGDLFKELHTFAQMTLKPQLVNFTARDLCPHRIVTVDRDKLYQVVLNLLLNAADAAGEGGRVALLAYENDGDYCLEVADDGPGVPLEQQEQIFELFFTTKPPGKGHGIGLTTCRSIVERHGGRMEVKRSEWDGAAFVARFHLNDAGRA
jgi:signal transduction histidine kinase